VRAVIPLRPVPPIVSQVSVAVGRGRVGVAVIEPHRSFGLQHPAHLAEYRCQRLDVLLECRLKPNLIIMPDSATLAAARAVVQEELRAVRGRRAGQQRAAFLAVFAHGGRAMIAVRIAPFPRARPIIPQPPIGRRGHDAIDAVVGDALQAIGGGSVNVAHCHGRPPSRAERAAEP
jgi:hypothetical protein